MPLSGSASTGNPFDDAGGDWLPAGQKVFIPPAAPNAPAPSSGLPKTPGGALNTLAGNPLGGKDISGALSGAAGLLSAIPSVSTSVSSRSGDASTGLENLFNYQAAFQVGGSGSQKQSAGLSSGGSGPLLYVVIAAILGVVAFSR